MTKAGASGAKSRARKTQQATGLKYTELRQPKSPRRHRGRVIQFLTESHEVATLPYQIAAAWTRQGLQVLMLHEYEPYRTDLDLYSRNVKKRKAAEARAQAHPGPRSTVLLHPARGHGQLIEQRTPWYVREEGGSPAGKDTPLREALEAGRTQFDIVVLMGGKAYPRVPLVDDFVLLAHTTDGIPFREGLLRGRGSDSRTEWIPLSPVQSAALLRDRHLQFLYHPVPLLGMVTSETHWPEDAPARPEPEFVKAVEENMAAVGMPLLGHITLNRELDNLLERQRRPATAATARPDHGVVNAAHAIHRHKPHL
ncbi:hypothetical protein OG898_28125 [Streptomyces sp. NBC_00193]|uniref:hypothetical protein n=1 Tax=Streptomyces sp. NBC_00193 TaxID=2975675 RepID=UPI00225C008B|nr:hypothetical protein [Streptomyces sp. NBC_00193]MCX5300305.1 hypothetical protein [Streptomyces sp. NBC_00193]